MQLKIAWKPDLKTGTAATTNGLNGAIPFMSPDAHYNVPCNGPQKRFTLQEYKDMMGMLFQHFDMELGEFKNMIIKDDWCAIRYIVYIINKDTGERFTQNTMEFVKFKENPDPIGVRVVEGWALSDLTLA